MALFMYQPQLFLRQVPNAYLKRYFTDRNLLTDFPWDDLGETRIAPLFQAVISLPDTTRRGIASDFRSITDMASSKGAPWLVQVGKEHNVDLAAMFAGKRSAYERAFFAFLDFRWLFDEALAVARWENLPHRSMELRNGLPKMVPDTSEATLRRYADALSAYYKEAQGRGEHCVAEHVLRSGHIDFFFAYPADYLDTFIGYEEDGAFSRKSWRPAFEVVTAYDRLAGTTELYAQGTRQLRDAVFGLFTRNVLLLDKPAMPLHGPAYNLEVLKNRTFPFDSAPTDKIVCVRVKSMRFQDSRGARVTFEEESGSGVYDVIDRMLDQTRTPLSELKVTRATLVAYFDNGTKRPKTVPWTITAPSSCTLRDSEEEITIHRKLFDWKIATNE